MYTDECNWFVFVCLYYCASLCGGVQFAALIKLPLSSPNLSPQGAAVFSATCLFIYNCIKLQSRDTAERGARPVEEAETVTQQYNFIY